MRVNIDLLFDDHLGDDVRFQVVSTLISLLIMISRFKMVNIPNLLINLVLA